MKKTAISVSASLDDVHHLLKGAGRVIAVIDRNIGELYYGSIPTSERIFIDTGEHLKTLDTVSFITSRLLEMEADRDILLLGIGGGITTDITGFTASIYKRGVKFAFLPTTLLAQVDAAIGGKNGVNLHGYKNILGTFSLPEFTFCCTGFLKTLPRREMLCGLAELLKTFIIADADAYEDTVRLFSDGKNIAEGITPLIEKAVGIKSGIVERDFKDTGERMKLNLGHTFAHAIEKCAAEDHIDITHGEAVAAGIVMAARLSEETGIAPCGLADRITRDFTDAGLPVSHPFSSERLYSALRNDKKRKGDLLNFITIRDIGTVSVTALPIEKVRL